GLTPGVSLHFGECCNPVPGDRIVGILDPAGSGLTVHAIDCSRLAEYEDRDDLWRDLQWTAQAEANTVTQTRLTATIRNAPGVLGQACGNIAGLRMDPRQPAFFDVDIALEVRDARPLTNTAAALRACPPIET